MKSRYITALCVILLCFTAWLVTKEICKCQIACEALMAGWIKPKVKQ